MKALKKVAFTMALAVLTTTITWAQDAKKTVKRGTCTQTYKASSYSKPVTRTKTTTKKGCDNWRKDGKKAFSSKTTFKPSTPKRKTSTGTTSPK